MEIDFREICINKDIYLMIQKMYCLIVSTKIRTVIRKLHTDSTDFRILYDICFMATDNDTVEIEGQLNSYYIRNQTKLAFVIFLSSAVIMCF